MAVAHLTHIRPPQASIHEGMPVTFQRFKLIKPRHRQYLNRDDKGSIHNGY